MSAKHRFRFDMIFKILLSISLLISGICLIAGCLSIYYSGADHPYSRETVAQAFSLIQIPIYISLGLIILNLIGAVTNSADKKRTFLKPSVSQALKRLSESRDFQSNSELNSRVLKERKIRKIHTLIRVAISGASAISFLLYSLNFSNFDRTDINGSMIKAMYVLLPCFLCFFIASLVMFRLNQKSKKREIEILKTAPLKSTADTDDTLNTYLKKEKRLRIIKLCLLSVFLCIAIIGFILGGTADVLTKAVNICTECIGLG